MSISLRSGNVKKELFNYLMNFRYAVRLNKPLLTLRIAQDYLRLLLTRTAPLRYVDIALDYACNLNCVHCSAERLKHDRHTRRMQLSDYERLAEQCRALGVITVGFTGGEPLVYPKLRQVIAAFKPGRTMISIKTNGVLLNDEWLRRLKSWGVDSISIGLGPVPDRLQDYDGLRGLPDTYTKSICAAQRAKEHGFRVIVGVVVSHENVDSEVVERILEYTNEWGMILIFGLAVPAGNWSAQRRIILTEEDRTRLRDLLVKYPHARTDFESNFCTRGCGAANEKLYVTPYGDVMPCPFVQISFGNVLQDSLRIIRNRVLSYPVFRGYPERCLAADHYQFIDECISRTFEAERLPVDHRAVPEMLTYDQFGNKDDRSAVPDLQPALR
jgi:MoaA/NifB/PqqE/SkfB family radical SAM enzyme